MDSEEIVCVHVNLKFLIFKSIEKNDNCLCDNFIINLADINDIESDNKSKEYFIKKFHKILKKKKRNEYECILNGTITEIAIFLFQHIELYIQISKIEYDIDGQNGDRGKWEKEAGESVEEGVEEVVEEDVEKVTEEEVEEEKKYRSPFSKTRRGKNTKLGKNKIHLLKSVDVLDDNINFENGKIYFKCLFKDLINDFEFVHKRKYENISNFYVSNDFIFSITVKFEECMIEKRDLEEKKNMNPVKDRYTHENDDFHYNHQDYHHYAHLDKHQYKYWHLVNLFHMTNLFYLYISFDSYGNNFFHENCVEVTVGDMAQSVSEKVHMDDSMNPISKNPNESVYSPSCLASNDEDVDNHHLNEENNRIVSDLPISKNKNSIGCHFSLTLIDRMEELYDYFCINDIHIIFNKTKLYVEKKGGALFSRHKKDGENWTCYKDMKKITYHLNTLCEDKPSLKFQATIMSIFLCSHAEASIGKFANPVRWRGGDSCRSESDNVDRSSDRGRCRNRGGNVHYKNKDPYPKCSKTSSWDVKIIQNKNKFNTVIMEKFLTWNFFLSVQSCHILELSNIYAEKRKTKQNDFFVKIESGFLQHRFISPFYVFQESKQIELKNCHVSQDFQWKDGKSLCTHLENEVIHFELSLREVQKDEGEFQSDINKDKCSGINIGLGELSLKDLTKELKSIMMKEEEEGPIQTYYKFDYCIPLYLNVFKEKYLTSELNISIYLSKHEGKIENERELKLVRRNISLLEEENLTDGRGLNKIHKTNDITTEAMNKRINYTNNGLNSIPRNIYEFKLWKEEEEKRMGEVLKKKEKNIMRKLIKKYEFMERERKNEFEIKKNELKEIVIKIKEEQINIKKNENVIKLKDKELNDEIYLLEKKLKKIKYAFEKSLYVFKRNLRKNNLSAQMIKEYDELISNYKNVLAQMKILKKENQEMKSILSKYNNKDNAIISNSYFEALKIELKRLKHFYKQTVEAEKRGDAHKGDTHKIYIKSVRKNRNKITQLITSIIPQIEYIYDLTNDDLLEEKFRSILRDLQQVNFILKGESKELEQGFPDECHDDTCDELYLNAQDDLHPNNSLNKYWEKEQTEQKNKLTNLVYTKDKGSHGKDLPTSSKVKNLIKNNNLPKGKKSLPYYTQRVVPARGARKDKGGKVGGIIPPIVSEKIKGVREKLDKITTNEKSQKRDDSYCIPKMEGFKKREKTNNNTKIADNLKSEINRLIETGIYNEDDTIIKNMKKKLNALL
ncbi:Cg7 protein [Plasmodium gonderi]|uniref:Cg7 protein n=1 Tax=Plasmodium gonderi TaxID=77519 RepID=A0A1Y1J9I5_PLAGO|nr:Cg7 protein [Plasmodium gonderi]GAW78930.1 Cg7 protein [Plasmodium gonderi]